MVHLILSIIAFSPDSLGQTTSAGSGAQAVPPLSPPGACLSDDERGKTVSAFTKGAESLRQESLDIKNDSAQLAGLILRIRTNAPVCAGGFLEGGDILASQIDSMNMVQKIRYLGEQGQQAGGRMAAAMDAGAGQYKKLDLCAVNACKGASSKLSELFQPVSLRAENSMADLRQIRSQYIVPAASALETRKHDIEGVLYRQSCAQPWQDYLLAMRLWKKIQQRFAALEERVARESAVIGVVAKAAAKPASSCSMAAAN